MREEKREGRHRHHHHRHHKHQKPKGEGSPSSEVGSGERSAFQLEDRIHAKIQGSSVRSEQETAAQADGSAILSSPKKSAQEHAALLDARIETKRAACQLGGEHTSGVHARDILGRDDSLLLDKSDKEDEEQEDPIGAEHTDNYQEDRGIGEGDLYPNIDADVGLVSGIGHEGLIDDDTGAIQAFVVPEGDADEANVVGIIKSDEEVEMEERQRYRRYFIGAVTCIVAVIVIIGVPITLKMTDVIGAVVTLPPTLSPSFLPSQSPSFMPSSSQFSEVVEKLYPLSGETLTVVGSPQHKAARWMIADQMDFNDPGFEQRYVMALVSILFCNLCLYSYCFSYRPFFH